MILAGLQVTSPSKEDPIRLLIQPDRGQELEKQQAVFDRLVRRIEQPKDR